MSDPAHPRSCVRACVKRTNERGRLALCNPPAPDRGIWKSTLPYPNLLADSHSGTTLSRLPQATDRNMATRSQSPKRRNLILGCQAWITPGRHRHSRNSLHSVPAWKQINPIRNFGEISVRRYARAALAPRDKYSKAIRTKQAKPQRIAELISSTHNSLFARSFGRKKAALS